MDLAIAMTAYRRPHYLRRVLDHLARCEGIAEVPIFARVDPSPDPAEAEEVRALVESIDFAPRHATFNRDRLGCDHNTYAAIDDAFCSRHRPGFVILVEDDVLLAPDAIDFYSHCATSYRDDPVVAWVSALGLSGASPDSDGVWRLVRRQHPRPWLAAIGTWRDRWFSPAASGWVGRSMATRGGRAPAVDALPPDDTLWDISLWVAALAYGYAAVHPEVSRTRNIGVDTSWGPPGYRGGSIHPPVIFAGDHPQALAGEWHDETGHWPPEEEPPMVRVARERFGPDRTPLETLAACP